MLRARVINKKEHNSYKDPLADPTEQPSRSA